MDLEPNLPLHKIIPWFAAAVVAIAGGTFAITRYSAEQHISAVEEQNSSQKEQIKVLKEQVQNLQSSPQQKIENSVPSPTLTASANQQETRNLVQKIQELESEKTSLVSKLSIQSQDALDPKSEVASLARQIKDSLKTNRIKALEGLFAIKDSSTLPILLSYYRKDPREATSSMETPIWKWFNVIWSIDDNEALKFMVEVLCSSDQFQSESAYDDLYNLPDVKYIKFVTPRLKEVALSNSDIMVRTRSKILLQHYQKQKQKDYRSEERRSIFQVLLDIESDVKKIRDKK
jgi:hypothetical protein